MTWIAAHPVLFAAAVVAAYLLLAAIVLRVATGVRAVPARRRPRHSLAAYVGRHEIGAGA